MTTSCWLLEWSPMRRRKFWFTATFFKRSTWRQILMRFGTREGWREMESNWTSQYPETLIMESQ
jgi:hypothetical protein